MVKPKPVIIAAIAAVLVLGVVWLLSPQSILVETVAVSLERFVEAVEEDGRARVRDRYLVTAPIAGSVPRTTLRAGDAVLAGEKLAEIVPNAPPLLDPRSRRELEERVGATEAAVEEAALLLERAKAALAQASADLERTRALKARDVVPAAKLERDTLTFKLAERDSAAAEKRRHVAEHSLQQARSALRLSSEGATAERFLVSAPIDGQVLKVIQESGGAVALGSPLFELGDPRQLEIAVDVLTSDAARIRDGSKVILQRWGGAALEGRVRRVEPSGFTKVSALGVEEQRAWVVADLVSPQEAWSRLGDGYRVEARIVVDEIDQAVVIPVGALFRRSDGWNVFVAEAGRARIRQVQVDRISGRVAAISGGLKPKETVVAFPPASLRDGSPIRLR